MPDASANDDAVAEYKRLLKRFLDMRPSGTRQKLAQAFGTHKSFISQITNPNYRVPLPEQHIPALFRVCHLSADEQAEFLTLYRLAHPAQALHVNARENASEKALAVPVPEGLDDDARHEAEQLILDFARRVFALVRNRKG